MLRFATTLDAVFLDILHEAIQFTIDSIEAYDFDPEPFEIQYENSSRVFHPNLARDTSRQLLDASRSAQWYQPTDYHWLLLYEALEIYCALFNDGELRETRLSAQYGIRLIDFDAIVDIFFWDTNFLLSEEHVVGLGMDGWKELAIHPEIFGITQRLTPHPEEQQLRPIEPDETIAASGLYRSGSHTYPSWEES